MAAAGGASIEDLHAAANRELAGKTPISVQLVAAAVRDLMALRLLDASGGLARGSAGAISSTGSPPAGPDASSPLGVVGPDG